MKREFSMNIDKWIMNYNRVKKEFWQIIVATLTIGILILLLISREGNNTIVTNSMETATEDVFIRAIKSYESQTGRRIYPTGREFLRRAVKCNELTTEEQIIDLIKSNEKYMFK